MQPPSFKLLRVQAGWRGGLRLHWKHATEVGKGKLPFPEFLWAPEASTARLRQFVKSLHLPSPNLGPVSQPTAELRIVTKEKPQHNHTTAHRTLGRFRVSKGIVFTWLTELIRSGNRYDACPLRGPHSLCHHRHGKLHRISAPGTGWGELGPLTEV